MHGKHTVEHAFKVAELDHVRSIARRAIGIGVHFEEDTIDMAGRHGGARQGGYLGAVSTRAITQRTRLLHRVCCIEHHRFARGGHVSKACHVDHETSVAKRRSALAHHHILVAGIHDLLDDILHVPRRKELTLLHVQCTAGLGRSHEQVGLTAQERGDLQYIHILRHLRAVLGLMHIGQHRHPVLALDLGQPIQAFDAGPTRSADGRAIGLVVTRFEDQTHAA